jgi:hypothetical protein
MYHLTLKDGKFEPAEGYRREWNPQLEKTARLIGTVYHGYDYLLGPVEE